MKANCWEVKKCGREPGGKKQEELGTCPVTTFEAADGFLGGENGGRACVFIIGKLAAEPGGERCDQTSGGCFKCSFFKKLKKKHKKSFRLDLFRRYIENSRDRGSHL